MRFLTFGQSLQIFLLLGVWGGRAWSADVTGAASATTTPPLKPEAVIALAQQQARTAEANHDMPGQAKALNDEADAYLRLHEFETAEKLLLQILHLQEKNAGRNSVPVSDALLSLGWYNNNMARYEAAQAALDRCREIRERVLGPETAPVAEVLNALGVLEENRSNLTLAEAFYQQAIAIQEKVLGPQSPVTANTWNNLATLYWIMGDYAQAQKFFTQALEVRQKTLGPNSAVVAKTLNNLALLDSSLGDYDEAESYFERALRIFTQKLGPDHPSTITTLSQLGLLYVREGDDARAEPLLEKAVQMRKKTYKLDHPDVARSLMQLALLYDRKKEYEKAEPLLTQALEIRRRTLGTEHPEYAASLAALARHNHAMGHLPEALPLYQEALKIDEEVLGKSHRDTLDIATDLTYLELELGQREEASKLAGDVIEAQQTALNGVFAFAPERQRLDFEHTMQPCELPAALDDPETLAQVILRTKGVVLDSLLEDEAMTRAARDPEVRELMEKKRLLSAKLLQAQGDLTGADFSVSPEALAERQKLEKEERDLEASLAEKGIGSGKTRRALATDVSEVRDALPGDAALVEFVVYRRYMGRLNSEQAYGALVLTHKGPAKWIPLAAAAGIDTQVRSYQKYLRRRVHEETLSAVLSGLDQSLCQPVVDALPEGIHRLILSPDGNLNFVSFATLLDGKGRFFGEDFELNYVSSGRDLLDAKRSAPLRKKLVVFADPDYDHLPGGSSRSHERGSVSGGDLLAALPGTEREALFLQQAAKSGGIAIDVYRGADASKANLGKQDSPYVLHLATHGLYLSADDLPNLPPSRSNSSPDAQSMSRSLLALAGASITLREWKKGNFPSSENDGLLTAQDVSGLNLDHTWLVVLSACDTGSGEAQAGEGVFGFRRGFAEAGAQNVLMTLWPVDDAGTASLMEAFYREALRSGDAPGALAQVQRASLVEVRKKSGLNEAVRQAGPFVLSY